MNSKNFLKLSIIIMLAIIMWFNPVSSEIPEKSWHLFVIFIGTMLGIIVSPMPLSAIALLGCAASVGFDVLSTKQILSGFGEEVVWLLVFAFVIARSIIKTGLAKRIAYYFIMTLGETTLGLSYGLVIAEFFLAPLIPSVTARGGGIICPILNSIFVDYDNDHSRAHSKQNLSFITLVSFQASVICSAMFVTAIASNPLIISFLNSQGIHISWLLWAKGAIVPGIISLAIIPFVIYLLNPPATKLSPEAPELARKALKSMGYLSKNEIIVLIIILGLIAGWILGKGLGFDATSVSLIGVVVLLVTGVLEWNDIASEKSAWDTFVWFGVVVMLSNFLSEQGTVKFLASNLGEKISQIDKFLAVPSLFLLYFYLHYFFASTTAHVTVLFATFLFLLINLGMPQLVAVMPLAYFSTLSGGLTHYGISSAPIYFGSKVVPTKKWWSIGFIISIINITIWTLVGYLWWKFIGWF